MNSISTAVRAVALGVLAASALQACPAPLRAEASSSGTFFLLLFLDGDALLCSPCLNRTLGFIRELPSDLRRTGVWIVVYYRRPKAGVDETLYRTMIGRRAGSVLKAHGLLCPVVVDEAEKWDGLIKKGTDLLVLDSRMRSARTFALPLSADARDFIHHITETGENHGSSLDRF